MSDFSFKHVYYSKKQFETRLMNNQNTVDLHHIGPRMFLCSDEMGMWIAHVLND